VRIASAADSSRSIDLLCFRTKLLVTILFSISESEEREFCLVHCVTASRNQRKSPSEWRAHWKSTRHIKAFAAFRNLHRTQNTPHDDMFEAADDPLVSVLGCLFPN
jgi:hypothetical protein